jgi:hypothetical protein
MTGSAAFWADMAGVSCEEASSSIFVSVRSGVTVALSLSLDLALAARMRVLKTCGLLDSRTM